MPQRIEDSVCIRQRMTFFKKNFIVKPFRSRRDDILVTDRQTSETIIECGNYLSTVDLPGHIRLLQV